MASRSHELRLAERLRVCEGLLDQIRTEALAGLDAWWADDLQKHLTNIHRLADLALDGKRVVHVEQITQADPKARKGKPHV